MPERKSFSQHTCGSWAGALQNILNLVCTAQFRHLHCEQLNPDQVAQVWPSGANRWIYLMKLTVAWLVCGNRTPQSIYFGKAYRTLKVSKDLSDDICIGARLISILPQRKLGNSNLGCDRKQFVAKMGKLSTTETQNGMFWGWPQTQTEQTVYHTKEWLFCLQQVFWIAGTPGRKISAWDSIGLDSPPLPSFPSFLLRNITSFALCHQGGVHLHHSVEILDILNQSTTWDC